MIGAGIHDGDLLVVDRSAEAKNGNVIIAIINGELSVKRYLRSKNQFELVPENPKYKPILINEGDDVRVWGVVTNVIHQL